jgi:amino acid adenylation domain-containing protein
MAPPFEAATIRRLEGHLQVLLAGIVADPGRRICELPLLTETERRQVLVEWNQTGSRFPDDECIHELFEAQVARTPEAVAVVCGNEQLTYRELNTRANQFAHYLRHRGVRPETLVGICIDRSSAMMIGLLGILKAGGAYLPLDPAYPRERLAFLLDDSRASLVLTQLQWLDLLPADRARIVVLDEVHSAVAQEPAENPSCDATGENLAYVIYTSGSTGLPKGVQVPHRAVVNFLHSMSVEPGLGEQEVLLAVTTLSFDISVLELFLPLTVGARVVIVSREVATDGASLGAEVEAAQVTVMQATPATWQLLKESGWQGSRHLKILCGGEALTSDLADHLLEMGASVWNLYGPTETTVFSTAYHVKSRRTPVSIGGPIANTEVYVLNAARQTVPIGVPGELYIGGAGLARGYLNRPELTAEKFVADPFSNRPGARLYRTGDQVRWRADGNLEFLGRLDHQVKLRGFRIEPVEIETALTGQPHVTQSVVLVREDRPGDQRLVAYVVLRESATEQTVSGLRQSLREKLPEYMVPSAFVILDALPLTPNGKVDRKALPVPEVNHLEPAQACVAPRTCVEEQLATIWREVLGVDRIGIRDNFFERGGHSLLATRLASHIRRQFGLEIPLIAIFEAPTIERLSLVLLQGQAKVMRSEGMNELLGELESISEENAERQLRGARIQ